MATNNTQCYVTYTVYNGIRNDSNSICDGLDDSDCPGVAMFGCVKCVWLT